MRVQRSYVGTVETSRKASGWSKVPQVAQDGIQPHLRLRFLDADSWTKLLQQLKPLAVAWSCAHSVF
jgi:hypothetical protein